MLLVRHNRLVAPYHDYAALPADMLDKLASGEVSPDIEPLPEFFQDEALIAAHMRRADYFVCSEAPRTQQTCAALISRFVLPQKEIRIDPAANEILFVPSRMMTEEDETPLQAARLRMYPHMLAGRDSVEPAESVASRILTIKNKYAGQNTVIFTHGFLMRLIHAAAAGDGSIHHALRKAQDMPHCDYLGTVIF